MNPNEDLYDRLRTYRVNEWKDLTVFHFFDGDETEPTYTLCKTSNIGAIIYKENTLVTGKKYGALLEVLKMVILRDLGVTI